MDFFQNVVVEYLRANRATFVNTEYCIQVNPGTNPDKSGPHWYCDAVAVNIAQKRCSLCEVSYSKTLTALGKRLTQWRNHWPEICAALRRDSGFGQDWLIEPHVFIPSELGPTLDRHLDRLPKIAGHDPQMPKPKVTFLESVLPWKYRSWDRASEKLA